MKDQLEEELNEFEKEHLVSNTEMNGKLIKWVIRNIITVLLYVYFWHIPWVKYTLIISIPLAIIGLVMIFGYNRVVKNQVAKTRAKMEQNFEEEE